MRKRVFIFAVLILSALIIVAVAYRELQLLPYPMGGGAYKVSPNGDYEASATNMTDETFWGWRIAYYEFVITNRRSGSTIKRHVLPISSSMMSVEFRGKGVIAWNPTSSEVKFGDGTVAIWSTVVP